MLEFIARGRPYQIKTAKSTKFHSTKVRRYKELDNTKYRPKSGRLRSCRTNIKAVRERVMSDSKRYMRKMTRDFKMDLKSMRKIVKSDLNLSPLKLKKRQHLTVLQQ